jgi:hypothetical protein
MTPVTTANSAIDLTENTLDVKEIIQRVEMLETTLGLDVRSPIMTEPSSLEEAMELELDKLSDLLARIQGKGDCQEWRGHGYPPNLIRDDYFVEWVKFLAEDVHGWIVGVPFVVEIDWQKTADNLRVDYKSVDFNGTTYWFLSPPYQVPNELFGHSRERKGPAIREKPSVFH